MDEKAWALNLFLSVAHQVFMNFAIGSVFILHRNMRVALLWLWRFRTYGLELGERVIAASLPMLLCTHTNTHQNAAARAGDWRNQRRLAGGKAARPHGHVPHRVCGGH